MASSLLAKPWAATCMSFSSTVSPTCGSSLPVPRHGAQCPGLNHHSCISIAHKCWVPRGAWGACSELPACFYDSRLFSSLNAAFPFLLPLALLHAIPPADGKFFLLCASWLLPPGMSLKLFWSHSAFGYCCWPLQNLFSCCLCKKLLGVKLFCNSCFHAAWAYLKQHCGCKPICAPLTPASGLSLALQWVNSESRPYKTHVYPYRSAWCLLNQWQLRCLSVSSQNLKRFLKPAGGPGSVRSNHNSAFKDAARGADAALPREAELELQKFSCFMQPQVVLIWQQAVLPLLFLCEMTVQLLLF